MILHLGACLEVLRTMPDNSVDSVVTDPPYGLSFMGKKWDYDVPSEDIWRECLRVLKPGGHLLAFAGTRTQHRMAVRIEDAGFEIRDMIAWVYGSGFPKSLDVSKAIYKAAGAERATDYKPNYKNGTFGKGMGGGKHGAQSEPPATDAARDWAGWGTALKPALEPITVARKPLGEKTVAANVLAHGTGGLNVGGCRVPGAYETRDRDTSGGASMFGTGAGGGAFVPTEGRWPANLIHDGSDEVVGLFPDTGKSGVAVRRNGNQSKGMFPVAIAEGSADVGFNDSGSAARFFYCAKANKKDRSDSNTHPTVKPTDLMRYLCRLVTPPGGVVLDPFMGSGSTGKAALLEGFEFIGIERDAEYIEIARARIKQPDQPNQPELFQP